MSDQAPWIDPATLPLVSLVVVNHNYARFLSACLRSIADQTYATWECIVVDNASADGSRAAFDLLVAGLPPPTAIKFRWRGLEANKHQTLASIDGFGLSQGQYVVFVDADDYLLPHCLAAHVSIHLSSRIAVGFTCGDMVQVRDQRIVATTAPGLSRFVRSGASADRTLLRHSLPPAADIHAAGDLFLVGPDTTWRWPYSATSAFCYRREAVGMMFERTPELKSETDAYLAHGIAALVGGIVLDRPVAAYRYHGSNVFSRHPPLDGLTGFDISQSRLAVQRIAREIIACYEASLESVASRLLEKRRFFDAVAAMATVAGEPPGATPQVMLHFLLRNLSRLRHCFGNDFIDRMVDEFAIGSRARRMVQREYRQVTGARNRHLSPLPRWVRRLRA
jgi:glycosyltransferase involved in cell wall biosynthesis